LLRFVYLDHHEVDELALGRQKTACTCVLETFDPDVPPRQRPHARSLIRNIKDPAPIRGARLWSCCLTRLTLQTHTTAKATPPPQHTLVINTSSARPEGHSSATHQGVARDPPLPENGTSKSTPFRTQPQPSMKTQPPTTSTSPIIAEPARRPQQIATCFHPANTSTSCGWQKESDGSRTIVSQQQKSRLGRLQPKDFLPSRSTLAIEKSRETSRKVEKK
jgi:hypothetical protein